MVLPESLSMLLSLHKKGLKIILAQGCHCKTFVSIAERCPCWQVQPPPGLTAWQEPLRLDFSPYLCPCLGTTSTTVHGGRNLTYPLISAYVSIAVVAADRNPGQVYSWHCAILLSCSFSLCSSLFSPPGTFKLGPQCLSTVSRSPPLHFRFFPPLGSFITNYPSSAPFLRGPLRGPSSIWFIK